MSIALATIDPQRFLFDVLIFAIAALAIGILVYQKVVKQRQGLTPWKFEKIDASPMQWQDLAAHLGFLGFLCSLIIFATLKKGGNSAETISEMSDMSMIVAIISQFLIMYGVPFTLFFLMLIPRANPLKVFGIHKPDFGKIAFYSILGVVASFAVLILISAANYEQFFQYIFGKIDRQAAVQMMKSNMGDGLKVATILSAILLAPVFEEIFFRGFLYTSLKKHTGAIFSILLSSLFFSLIHNGPFELLPLFLIGAIFAIVYELSGSLLTSITVHMMFNLINTAALLSPQAPN